MKKIIALILMTSVAGAFAADRISSSAFKSAQKRVLNGIIGQVEYAQTTASLTNGATLTPTVQGYVVSGIGGANDTTNTITLASATDGQELTIIVSPTSTNLITIADSGNTALSSAWLGDNNDVISLVGVSTNWVEVSASDN